MLPVSFAERLYHRLRAGNILSELGQYHHNLGNALLGIITVHLIFAVIIIQNPVSQLVDRWIAVPSGMNIKRILVRTAQVGLCLGIGMLVCGVSIGCFC